MNLAVRAERDPLWLCFEPWATEYTLLPGAAVVVRFGDGIPAEVTHHRDGMTFLSFGPHPDLYAEDGSALELYSEHLPPTPDVPADTIRAFLQLMPPIRSESDRLNRADRVGCPVRPPPRARTSTPTTTPPVRRASR